MFRITTILLFVGALAFGVLAFGLESTRHALVFDIAFIVLLAACVTSWIFAMARQLDSVASQHGQADRVHRGNTTHRENSSSRADT